MICERELLLAMNARWEVIPLVQLELPASRIPCKAAYATVYTAADLMQIGVDARIDECIGLLERLAKQDSTGRAAG